MTDQSTTSRNQDFRIQELSSLVRSGNIRIPEFQRSFRWSANDVLSLFDSILRGYPFGGMLLWRRKAPAGRLTIGAIEVNAKQQANALWVIDGQQRITSLVNAVDPDASRDERFAISYLLSKKRFILGHDAREDLAIPLPDLFDLGRAFAWLQQNPDAAQYASEIQRVTGLLRDVEVAGSVIEEGNEALLRDIFDRINSAGKRLRGSEIFDAIHGAGSDNSETLSMSAIADRLDTQTEFGRLPDQTVYQAILVVRHPDLTRNVRNEFSGDREAAVNFSSDAQSDAYHRGEAALLRVIRFLQTNAGVPHSTFVPFRFHLLVLARFFAHYPEPAARNLELLSRWVWRSTTLAESLGYTGSTANIRSLAYLVQPDSESESVQRLLDATKTERGPSVPDVRAFRTNKSSGKVILGALWSLSPINPATGHPLSYGDLAGALESETSPRDVALELIPRVSATNAANRVLAVVERSSFLENLDEAGLQSHLLTPQLVDLLSNSTFEQFIEERQELLYDHLLRFVSEKTGMGLEFTPPLKDLDFDDIEDEDEDEDESVVIEGDASHG
jgi:hypothetical protein